MSYAVLVTKAAQKDFRRLPSRTAERVRATLAGLEPGPRSGAEKLAVEGTFRIRVGDYRIVFRVDDRAREVLVTRIKHRREAYRR